MSTLYDPGSLLKRTTSPCFALRIILILVLLTCGQLILHPELWAYSIVENKIFAVGSYAFKLEIQISGKGSLKKSSSLTVSSLKVKIKNERASSEVLKVKAIRIYQEPAIYQDIETKGFSVAPGQWVTKYFRLSRRGHHFINAQGFVAIEFENFSVRFHPRERKFQGPI